MLLLFLKHSLQYGRHPLLEKTAKGWTGELADGDETDDAKSSLSIRFPGARLENS